MDTLDTRKLQTRLDELESEHDAFIESDEYDTEAYEDAEDAWGETPEGEALEALRMIKDDIGGAWNDGVTLIKESDFEAYAQEFAADIGLVTDDKAWPFNCINWDAAASQLQIDYQTISYMNEDYLYRA